MFRKYYNTGVCIAAALLLVPQHVAGQSMVLDSGRVVNTTTGEVTGNTGPSFNNSVAFNPNPTQGDFNAGTTANIVSSLMGGGGGGGGVGCIDGSGNPIASILGAGIGNALGGQVGSLASSLVGNALGGQVGSLASSLVGNALGDQLQSITGSLLNTALNGGIAALTGGLLAGVVGGDVKVFDKQNNKVAIEQVKLLQQILTVQNITCATQQQILAAIGVAGVNQKKANLPAYTAKLFGVYQNTTNVPQPGSVIRQGVDVPSSYTERPTSAIAEGEYDFTKDLGGIYNQQMGTPEGIAKMLGVSAGDITNIKNFITGAQNIANQINQVMNQVNQIIGLFGGGFQGFVNNVDQMCGLYVNFFSPELIAEGPDIQAIRDASNNACESGANGPVDLRNCTVLTPSEQARLDEDKGNRIRNAISKNKTTKMQQTCGEISNIMRGVGIAQQTFKSGDFQFIKPEDILKVLNISTTVNESNCSGKDVRECLNEIGIKRQEFWDGVISNTLGKNAARNANIREAIQKLVYGGGQQNQGQQSSSQTQQNAALKAQADISLLNMMAQSTSLREDIQANTAAVMTGLYFQIQTLETLTETNVHQAAGTYITRKLIAGEAATYD